MTEVGCFALAGMDDSNGFAGTNRKRFSEAEENASNLLANNVCNLKNKVQRRPSFHLCLCDSPSSSTLLHASIYHHNSLLISLIPLFLSSIFTHPSWNWIIPLSLPHPSILSIFSFHSPDFSLSFIFP